MPAFDRAARDQVDRLERLLAAGRNLTSELDLQSLTRLSDEIVRALADADAPTVKAVRSYERHHLARRVVSAEVVRVSPTARAGPGEDQAG